MEHFITERVTAFRPPSADVKLVLFAQEEILQEQAEVKTYLIGCAKYAKEHGVYLVSGLTEWQGYLCLFLFDSNGKPICRQPALHLSLALQGKLQTGDRTEVVYTELGQVALCVDADLYYPKVIRTMALKGADLVIAVTQPDPLQPDIEPQTDTVWSAAQTNQLYLLHQQGKSCMVACPASLTRSKDGFLRKPACNLPDRFGFNLSRLEEVRMKLPLLQQLNGKLIQEHAELLRR